MPKIVIGGGSDKPGAAGAATGNVMEALLAMLLSDKIGAELRGTISPPSAEVESLRKQLQQSLHKTSAPPPSEAR